MSIWHSSDWALRLCSNEPYNLIIYLASSFDVSSDFCVFCIITVGSGVLIVKSADQNFVHVGQVFYLALHYLLEESVFFGALWCKWNAISDRYYLHSFYLPMCISCPKLSTSSQSNLAFPSDHVLLLDFSLCVWKIREIHVQKISKNIYRKKILKKNVMYWFRRKKR